MFAARSVSKGGSCGGDFDDPWQPSPEVKTWSHLEAQLITADDHWWRSAGAKGSHPDHLVVESVVHCERNVERLDLALGHLEWTIFALIFLKVYRVYMYFYLRYQYVCIHRYQCHPLRHRRSVIVHVLILLLTVLQTATGWTHVDKTIQTWTLQPFGILGCGWRNVWI